MRKTGINFIDRININIVVSIKGTKNLIGKMIKINKWTSISQTM